MDNFSGPAFPRYSDLKHEAETENPQHDNPEAGFLNVSFFAEYGGILENCLPSGTQSAQYSNDTVNTLAAMKALGQRGSVRLRINYRTAADLTKLKVELQDFVSNPQDFAFGPHVSKKFGTPFIQ
jgi:hypothetical protein